MKATRLAAMAVFWLALVAGIAPAIAQSTNTQLLALINSNVPSGNPAVLTAASMRAVLDAMVNSTNVASGSCPGSSAVSPYQPFANNTNSPAGVILQVFDGANCVPWAVFNTTTHGLTVIGSASAPRRNIAARFGSMDVFQRGAGGSASIAVAASTTAYTVDGCYLATGTNEISTVAAVAGIAPVSNKAVSVARNNGQTGIGTMTFGCPLDTDELSLTRGSYVTVSFWAQAGANWSPSAGAITANVLCGTATPVKQVSGYSGQTTVASTSPALTAGGSAAQFQVTSAAVVPSNCTQMEVQWTWVPAGTAGAADSVIIDSVQLEVVAGPQDVASSFQSIDFVTQLRMAQRHFWKSFRYGTAPAQNVGAGTGEVHSIAGKASTTSSFSPVRFPVSMRIVPNITTFNPAATNAQVRDITASVDHTATGTSNGPTEDELTLVSTGNASTAVGDLLAVHVTADAGI